MSSPTVIEKFSGTIANCYDSHVHWQATGTFRRHLQLHDLFGAPMQIEQQLQNIWKTHQASNQNSSAHDREWITGFGWDQHRFQTAGTDGDALFTHESLDRVFGARPVFFIRIDGHAAWVNRAALEQAGLWQKRPVGPTGGEIQLKPDGYPNGILLDHAMQIVERLLPARTPAQIRDDLLFGQKIFHAAGFTHIRDLSGDEAQWHVTTELEKNGELALAVEQFFGVEDPNLFDRQLDLAVRLNREWDSADCGGRRGDRHALVRPRGIKIFLDGALGSEGALLSCEYCTRAGHRGLQLLDKPTLRDFIVRTWRNELPVAVHAIGDAAADILAETAGEIESGGLKGELHIEHAELLQRETIARLAKLHHVECFLQPCHYLSDRKWLREKLGPFAGRAFRYRELEDAGIPIWFGSDSPIEEPSVLSTLQAIDLAQRDDDIPPPRHHGTHYQSHPDVAWVPNTHTLFHNGRIESTTFSGRHL